MISIIIPVYNQAEKLSRCLESILAQTILTPHFPLTGKLYEDDTIVPPLIKGGRGIFMRLAKKDNNFRTSTFKSPQPPLLKGEDGTLELIIVNDGSTDNINEIITNYELRITNFKVINQENKGSNSARNRGAKEASGEYIIFCDADIIMEPEMLEIMLSSLEKSPQASYAYSSFKYGFKTFKLWPFDAGKLKKMPYIHTTSLIRREHFPGFDEKIKRLQDWDLWLTILEYGHTGVWIDKVLFKVQGGGTISSWLPSFAYKLFPFLKSVKKYKAAEKVIRTKHNLSVIASEAVSAKRGNLG